MEHVADRHALGHELRRDVEAVDHARRLHLGLPVITAGQCTTAYRPLADHRLMQQATDHQP